MPGTQVICLKCEVEMEIAAIHMNDGGWEYECPICGQRILLLTD